MKVLDADGNEVARGEVGEIWMKPPEVASYRYIGAEARTRDGWESLGDMGWMDDDGYLFIADRRTDLILAGGANIYPAEVEAALEEHPAVLSCAVIGVPTRISAARARHCAVERRTGYDLRGSYGPRAVQGPGSRAHTARCATTPEVPPQRWSRSARSRSSRASLRSRPVQAARSASENSPGLCSRRLVEVTFGSHVVDHGGVERSWGEMRPRAVASTVHHGASVDSIAVDGPGRRPPARPSACNGPAFSHR